VECTSDDKVTDLRHHTVHTTNFKMWFDLLVICILSHLSAYNDHETYSLTFSDAMGYHLMYHLRH